jgi:DNA invertase Pin-like site-specific DNA recombinase
MTAAERLEFAAMLAMLARLRGPRRLVVSKLDRLEDRASAQCLLSGFAGARPTADHCLRARAAD